MRELLCVPQSSKERLRRSRTESSGAAPAIEELAGEARQVRPAGPRADQYQPGSDFSRAQEVWRESGPPAPASIKFSRKFRIPPPFRARTAEVGNFRSGTAFLHPGRSGGRPALQLPRASLSRGSSAYRLSPDRAPQKSEIPVSVPPFSIRRGLEGARPSSSREHYFPAEVQHIASLPLAHRRSRKFSLRYRLRPSEEVWRASSPPAPASIISPRKFAFRLISQGAELYCPY